MRRSSTGFLVVALALLALLPRSSVAPAVARGGHPDIVVIMTDDQRWDSLARMPALQAALVRRGRTFRRAIVTNPLCCPSRATFLTGRFSHSTGVYSNKGPHGGWARFNATGAETTTLATALNVVGYRTSLVGKYLNEYDNAGAYVPPGWDRWFAFAGANGDYYGYRIYDGSRFRRFGWRPRAYSTDVLADRAVREIRGAAARVPLFLYVAPYAPHGPTTPAPRHVNDLAGATVPIGPAVEELDVSDKPAFIRERPRQPLSEVRSLVRRHWESLLAVDDLVRRVVDALRDEGRLDDTLLVFTSDNGFSFDEHRWRGKLVPYEESIRVPLIMRFDGRIPAGSATSSIVSNVDLAPTLAQVAGATLDGVDGVSLRPLFRDGTPVRTGVLLESNGGREGVVPPYCGIRTVRFTFVRWGTGEEELYALGRDPYQLRNAADRRPGKASDLRQRVTALCQPVPPGFAW